MSKDYGWIKLHRKLIDSEIWGNPQLVTVWIWCLLKASNKKQNFVINSKKIILKPGQFVTGRKTASREIGISENSFYRYIKLLEKLKMLTRKANNRYTVITIVNWGKYQAVFNEGDTVSEQQMNNTRTTGGCSNEHIQEYIESAKASPKNGERLAQEEVKNDDEDDDWDWDWSKVPAPWEEKEDE